MYVCNCTILCVYSVSPVRPHLLSMVQCGRDLIPFCSSGCHFKWGRNDGLTSLVRTLGTGTYMPHDHNVKLHMYNTQYTHSYKYKVSCYCCSLKCTKSSLTSQSTEVWGHSWKYSCVSQFKPTCTQVQMRDSTVVSTLYFTNHTRSSRCEEVSHHCP